VQTGTPLPQSMAAESAQGLVEVQLAPSAAGHSVHVPPRHTKFAPHPVPSGIAVPVSVHVAVLPQVTVPMSQGFVGTQAPAAHGVGRHEPPPQAEDGAAQVEFVVPSATSVPTRHTGAPVLQSMVAVATQLLSRVQEAPSVQGRHAPALQTSFVPQAVPAGRGVPVSVQVKDPVEQEVIPASQGLAGVQEPPAVQEEQAPARQTSFVPHAVPSGWLPELSTHTGCPLEQEVAPV
jgi:hypothetical protein